MEKAGQSGHQHTQKSTEYNHKTDVCNQKIQHK